MIVPILLLLVLLGALLLVPLGLPGVWLMVLVLLGVTLAGEVAWLTWGVLAGLALLSELVEWGAVAWAGRRYGGSSRAFWGALAGGLVGAVIGAPVPLLGTLIAGAAGTFVGAAAITLHETRSLDTASRVGWGAALARTLAVGMKTAVGVLILVVGGTALFVG